MTPLLLIPGLEAGHSNGLGVSPGFGSAFFFSCSMSASK